MKALILNEFNTPFLLQEIPAPNIKKWEVLVKIVASGVNPLDLKIKAGKAAHAQPKLPNAILGIDMSGIVAAVGGDVKGFTMGDEVFGMVGGIAGIPGTLAEYVAADPALIALKPASLSFREAAALPLNTITAWEALVDRAAVRKGNTVLVHGGAGGVGHLAIQIARARGAKVFATVRPGQQEIVRSFGATPIDHTSYTVESYVNEFTDDEGFDVILDTVGGLVLDASFNAVKRYTGRVVSILGWGTHSLAPLSFRGASYSGVFTLYPLISGSGRQHHGQILGDVALLVTTGRMRPMVDEREFSLETIDKAYQCVENGTANGKIIISINNPE